MGWRDGHYRSLVIATHPAVEPVTVQEAKSHLRIDGAADDTMLAHYITAARTFLERRLSRSFIDTKWTLRRDTFPAYAQELPRPPFSPTTGKQAVEIVYVKDDSDGTVVSMTEEDHFTVDRFSTPPMVFPAGDELWPTTAAVENAVAISWWSGYGATGAAVPPPLRHAVLMLAGAWFMQREAISTDGPQPVPYGVEALIDVYKWGGDAYG